MESEQLRRIAIVTAFFLMLIPGIVFGDVFNDNVFNVLVYPENPEISSYITSFFPQAVLDEQAIATKESRRRAEFDKTEGEKLASEYKSENESKISESRSEFTKYEADPYVNPFYVQSVEYKGKAIDRNALVSGDRNLLRYMCLESKADLLVIPVVSRIMGFNHMSVYRYTFSSDQFEMIFERISPDSDRFTVSSVLKLSSSFFEQKPSIVRLDNLVDGAYVKIDDTEVSVMDSSILTTEGQHVMEIGAPGHASRLIGLDVQGNSVVAIDASLVSVYYSDLTINSFPSSTISVNGTVLGETPIVLDSYSLPFSIRLEKDLYMGKSLGITENLSEINVELKPAWMGNKDLLKQSKDKFYWSFARSLLIFGTNLLVGLFNDGSKPVLSAVDMAFKGVMTVSVVYTVGCLVDYFRQTEYISP